MSKKTETVGLSEFIASLIALAVLLTIIYFVIVQPVTHYNKEIKIIEEMVVLEENVNINLLECKQVTNPTTMNFKLYHCSIFDKNGVQIKPNIEKRFTPKMLDIMHDSENLYEYYLNINDFENLKSVCGVGIND